MDTVSFLNHTSSVFVRFSWIMLLQSSLLIVILLGLDVLLRQKVRAVFRYCLWMLVLIKLVLPVGLALPCSPAYYASHLLPETKAVEATPLPEMAVTNPVAVPAQESISYQPSIETPAAATPTERMTAPENAPIQQPSISWQAFVSLGWLMAVLVMLGLLIQRVFFVNSLIRQSKPADEDLLSQLKRCTSKMSMQRPMDLRISPNATSPSVCGLIQPVILIPDNLTNQLNTGQMDAILMHELAHIKRGDLWVNLVQALLQIIYFYNPLLWVANAVIRRIREQAVDEMVLVAMDEQAEDYPQTLLNVSKLVWSKPMLSLRLIGVVESKSALSARIKHILSRPFPKSAKIGLVGLALIFITAAVLLPMAKAQSNKIGLFDRKTLIKFESKGQPNGTSVNRGDTTDYSKEYDVVFREGEKLLVFAELYEAGKPMRRLGHKIFEGRVEPQRLSASLIEKTISDDTYKNTNCQINIKLGDENLEISTDIPAPVTASGSTWGWFQSDSISKYTFNNNTPGCQIYTLLKFFRDKTKSNEECQIWVPNDHIGEVGKDKQILVVRMVPVSQLNYPIQFFGPMPDDQLPDGSILKMNHETRDYEVLLRSRYNYYLSVKSMLVPVPELTAHRYYKAGEPIKIEMKQLAGDWKPSLSEICENYDGTGENPFFILVNGKEYGPSPLFGPFGGTTQWIMMPPEAPTTPGKYTFAYGWKNLDVTDPGKPDEPMHFDRLTTNEVEFEVVDEVPDDYFQEIYEDRWDAKLDAALEPWFTDNPGGVAGTLIGLKVQSLPFDIAFDVYAQAEDMDQPEQVAQKLARKANSGGNYLFWIKPPSLTWDNVGQKRWRIILEPSQKVAAEHPPIRNYYGRQYSTDWLSFEKSKWFDQNREMFKKREQEKPTNSEQPATNLLPGFSPQSLEESEQWQKETIAKKEEILKQLETNLAEYIEGKKSNGQPVDESVVEEAQLTINGLKLLIEQERSKLKEQSPNPELSTTNSQDYTATLPNGVTVELLGVAEVPESGDYENWWKPDGSPLANRPFKRSTCSVRKYDNRKHYCFAFSTSGKNKYGGTLRRMMVASSSGGGSGMMVDEKGQNIYSNTLDHTLELLPVDLDTTEITFGFQGGPWKMLAKATDKPAGVTFEGKYFEVTPAKLQNGKLVVKTYEAFRYDVKDKHIGFGLIIEKDGQETIKSLDMFASDMTDDDEKGIREEVYEIDLTHTEDFTADMIKDTCIRYFPFEKVTFKNVSLRPGGETEGEGCDTIRGQVIGWDGKPVTDARILLGGISPRNFGGGPPVSKIRTDKNGQFAITDIDKRATHLLVWTPRLDVWKALLPESGNELRINLPKPATLKIRYDIEDADKEGKFRLELETWKMDGWTGLAECVRNVNVPNKGEIVLTGLTPGLYDLARIRHLRSYDSGMDAFCDRKLDLALEAGTTTVMDFVRNNGQPILGLVTGVPDDRLKGVFVHVRDERVTGDPKNFSNEWQLATYDGVVTNDQGNFITSRIESGTYTVVAKAYPVPIESGFRTGIQLPDYVGTARVTVPEEGKLDMVRIEMKSGDFIDPALQTEREDLSLRPGGEREGEVKTDNTVHNIVGQVTDQSGNPVAGALVEWEAMGCVMTFCCKLVADGSKLSYP